MAAQKVRRKPAEITIPRLSDQVITQRARRTVDLSITALIYNHFSMMPERSDMQHLRSLFDRTEGPDTYTRLFRALRQFGRDRPGSVINRYLDQTGSVSFLVVGEGERARIAFNSQALARDVRDRLAIYGSLLTSTLADLSREGYPLRRTSMGTAPYGMDDEMLRTLAYYIDLYTGARGTALPVTASIDKRTGDLMISRRS